MNKKQVPDINQKQNLPTHYIGIGASAGGLEALEELLRNMPGNTGMAFIIVQHLSPDYKSMMVELLSRKTKMKVVQIEDGMVVEANIVYLVPPKKNLEIYHSRLILTEQVRDAGLNLPIDIFFRSLAMDQRKFSIGIILSGTGSDGSLGIRAIKEHGGMVMVQDYKNAKFDGMPKSAIATGLVDYVIDAAEMSDALIKFVEHPLVVQNDKEKEPSKEETAYLKILSIIRTHVGQDFSFYKPKTIVRRIERRISVNQMNNHEEYVELLLHSKKECEILAKEFLIGVTQFFRDEESYTEFEKKVIPGLFKKQTDNQKIRIWSVACSTGEEAYSLAILCQEYIEKNSINADVKIFATDLDKEAIKFAGMGIYSENIISDISQERIDKYFIKKREAFQVKDTIRQMVVFSHHNVISDPPFSKINLISCRNLLIYLKNEIQDKILGLFQYALVNNGYLFLGNSESLSISADAFEVLDTKNKLFKYKQGKKLPSLSTLLDVRTAPGKYGVEPLGSPHEQGHQGRNSANDQLYEKVVNHFAPAGVIVDQNNNVIHFFKDVQKYLVYPEGRPSFNIVDIASPQLAMVISNMLFKVRKEEKEVILRKVKFKNQDETSYLNITAKPITLSKNESGYTLLTIELYQPPQKNKEEEDAAFKDYDINEQATERIKDLEREIQYRDENLQTTVEELETSNEELQATNEELVSSNEELQSTNEELQSVNEELYTVNSQYQEKIQELTTLNNDMNNLLANTQIGTLFLDSSLTVRKYTPEINKIINIMDIDIGRPFSHLTLKCDYEKIYSDVNEVLDKLVTKEVEIQTQDGNWYLIRMQPYRHGDKSIHGVLLTQVNISELQKNKQKYQNLFQTMIQGVVYQDAEGKITMANPAAEQILGLSLDQMKGLTSRDPRWKAVKENGDEFPGDEHPAMVALKTGKPVNNVIMRVYNPKKKQNTWININAVPLFKKGSKGPVEVYATIEDITVRYTAELNLKQANEDLLLSEKKYQMLFNSLSYGFAYHKIIINSKGKPIDYKFVKVNRAFEELTGLKQEEVVGKTVKKVLPKTEDFWIETYGKVALENETFEFEHYSRELKKTFMVQCYSPEKGYFVTLFKKA